MNAGVGVARAIGQGVLLVFNGGTSRFCRPAALAGRLAFVAAALLITYVATMPAAWVVHGGNGLVAAAVALGLCLAGGMGALATDQLLGDPELLVHRVLAGMILRMGLPLGLLLAVYSRGGPLVDVGLGGYVVVFYVVMLASETWMLIAPPRGRGRTL